MQTKKWKDVIRSNLRRSHSLVCSLFFHLICNDQVHSGTLGMYMPWAYDSRHLAERNRGPMLSVLEARLWRREIRKKFANDDMRFYFSRCCDLWLILAWLRFSCTSSLCIGSETSREYCPSTFLVYCRKKGLRLKPAATGLGFQSLPMSFWSSG